MKHYERRAAGAFPYYKLATWDAVSLTWRDGKKTFPTIEAARKTTTVAGRYRVSEVTEAGRSDLEQFEVE